MLVPLFAQSFQQLDDLSELLKHKKMKRRSFLQKSALASTSIFVPAFLRAYQSGPLHSSRSGKILVIVQLSGGNDGLNTVVPFRNDIYYQQRPSLAIGKNEVVKLSDQLGLNPVLSPLQSLYDDGLLSIINNVGYPNPDRSHFRSMDIWHTASESDEYLSTGWLGRYLDSSCEGCQAAHHALEIDDELSLALKGQNKKGFAMSNPNQLKRQTNNPLLKHLAEQAQPDHEENVAYLYKILADTYSSADYLTEKAKTFRSKASYPTTPFGRRLQQISELICADTDTRIYYVSLTGFDTHVNQKNQQERLLKQYAEGMKTFVQDLQQNNLLDDTLIMTFSEFGRRVKQNASRGTDHGTANNLFLMGGKLKHPGFYNEGPDLSSLDNGDLIYKVDFRDIYATILNKWLEGSSQQILNNQFQGLPFI